MCIILQSHVRLYPSRSFNKATRACTTTLLCNPKQRFSVRPVRSDRIASHHNGRCGNDACVRCYTGLDELNRSCRKKGRALQMYQGGEER
ncbi:hypothetical protein BJX70DRAFT_360058 [Aspergillus crustosus]